MPASATSTESGRSLPAARHAALVAAVQRNCDLADAHHADGKSLCTYLLGMREYFRWETGLPLGQSPERARLSGWIAERESRWEAMRDEGATFVPLPLADGLDPFDEASVNECIAGERLAYGAGIGLFGAPLFFLGECRLRLARDGARVIVAGDELARGFNAPPAVSRGGLVIVRLDALRRWLWTRVETARHGPPGQAFVTALRAYGDPEQPATVERMAEGETETLILHELGELQATALLGPDWESMLAGVEDRRTELVVRAVRDLLADCLVTLPRLVEARAEPSLHFWLAGFDGLRRSLAPALALAFGRRPQPLDLLAVDRAARVGRKSWSAVAHDMLSDWQRGCHPALRQRVATLTPSR